MMSGCCCVDEKEVFGSKLGHFRPLQKGFRREKNLQRRGVEVTREREREVGAK